AASSIRTLTIACPLSLDVPTRPSKGELHEAPSSCARMEVRNRRLRSGGPTGRCRAVVELRSPPPQLCTRSGRRPQRCCAIREGGRAVYPNGQLDTKIA